MSRVILVYNEAAASTYADQLARLLPSSAGYRIFPCTSREEAARAVGEAEIIFCWRFPTDLFREARRLRWVQAMGAGVEDLVIAPLPDTVLVTRVVGLFGVPMSEYVFAHMLAHAQRLQRQYAQQADRLWKPFMAGRLAGARLGIAGVGSIGLAMAARGKAFGMEVWGLARTPGDRPHVDRLFTPDQVRAFTAGVDYLVSTLPDTPECRGLIDPEAMKEGAVLINVGRGATIDEDAILRAVRSGRIHAVLDVFRQEPLPPDHPFWTEPNITVTPHLSGLTRPAEAVEYFVANLGRFERGEPLVGVVDRDRGY
ncbi:glyoxylate/hydroxypyruvate reductase A [Symbiobacterium terraclitae]|uniref:Glyoxylate/hydroxypyruvate reductase A n=1 Tax=Symbiobacterium terraclitae TaxID=557451 RepID=A0ABS4JRQ1_9FIRM|nr:D-2-hydroxyacid dehydrogenase [Symbiobacterium terraclitae]MBP2018198.1 glyoxylate/hydroxypyruvate reductase A [Symbiobacterium terraclitae]